VAGRADDLAEVSGQCRQFGRIVALMIIWLASYPRSGNHLLRMMLQRCFDLGSYEIYQGVAASVEPEEAAILGVRQFGAGRRWRWLQRPQQRSRSKRRGRE